MLRVRRAAVVAGAVLAVGLLSSACTDGPVDPGASAARPDLDKSQHVSPPILSSERTPLQEGIAHYTYDVAVDDGPYGVIRLHRVVRERRPDKPVRTTDAVFLLAGAPNYFEGIFVEPLISQAVPWDHSIAVFLAQNDIDVWGMDYAWALVPAEETDLDFMQGWGLQRDIDDATEGLSVARSIRVSTGQGFGKLHLLGFSYGGFIAYPLVGEETQRPPGRRNVKGLIALDTGFKLKDESHRTHACAQLEAAQANLDAGIFSDDSGLFLNLLGMLATSAPDDPSPIFPGLTNFQAALFLGARTELVTGQFWHFVGGDLNEYGIPTDLLYTDSGLWLDVLSRAVPPHQPMQTNVDVDALFCGNDEVPFDDHLDEITLPILQLGAAGGIGPHADHTATFTASNDITTVTVQLQADADRAIDFGHGDVVMGADAEELVWRPLLDWLLAHHPNRAYPGGGTR